MHAANLPKRFHPYLTLVGRTFTTKVCIYCYNVYLFLLAGKEGKGKSRMGWARGFLEAVGGTISSAASSGWEMAIDKFVGQGKLK